MTLLAIEPPRPGRTYRWAVEALKRRSSSDVEGPECIDRSYCRCWDCVLARKRRDSHYPSVVRSLVERGWLRPLEASVSRAGEVRLSDGHHRLAAAVEMGAETVPVYLSTSVVISEDSGYWAADPEWLDDAVPYDHVETTPGVARW